VIGLVVDNPDQGDPAAFVYVGVPLALDGVACAVVFVVLWRREAERRRRRRAGLRARVPIVSARMDSSIRSGSRIAMHLTVDHPTAGRSEPTNFEPVLP
jgi:hypothetical protein